MLIVAAHSKFQPVWNGHFNKSGVYSMSCESTPVVWQGRLLLMESQCATGTLHAGNWNVQFSGHSYFSIKDFATGNVLVNVSASVGWGFFSAIVDDFSDPASPTLWVFGTGWDRADYGRSPCGTGPCPVRAFWTKDMLTWSSRTIFHAPAGYRPCNTAPTYDPHRRRFVLMLDSVNTTSPAFGGWFAVRRLTSTEMGLEPSTEVGSGAGADLSSGWEILPLADASGAPLVRDAHQRFGIFDAGACPAFKYNSADRFFYATSGGDLVTVARSRDLVLWEMSHDLFLYPTAEDANVSQYGGIAQWLGPMERLMLSVPSRWDTDSNDADFVEVPAGVPVPSDIHGVRLNISADARAPSGSPRVVIIWGASSQGALPYSAYSSCGVYEGTQAALLASYFPS
eukprot:TRINITY_DN33992_c0_g1_i1.p1 TRINITY_DN33992_c0_g1~~TRINITY_DN33992_c0_g1_i1.p1  ORF type:complete len:456 (-),score=51.33 TRINITY_DN33992_c0_g1_i1:414-1604(-)